MNAEREYLSVADTAKLIRTNLKQVFRDVKFSVRSSSYSGGASIRIHWTDGPCPVRVERVAKRYEGADFDGMQDLKTSKTAVLMGADGRPREVRFGADFVFCEREVTDREAREKIIADLIHERCTLREENGVYYWGQSYADSVEDWARRAVGEWDFEQETALQVFDKVVLRNPSPLSR